MYKIRIALMVTAISLTPLAFADDAPGMMADASGGKPCAVVAKACRAAGFTRSQAGSKRFWFDCMKPILLGQTVQGVTIDPAAVQACRVNKVETLKKELQDLQQAVSKTN